MKTKKLRTGLIGNPLGHSWSPEIHALLGDYEYRLMPMEEEAVGPFLAAGDFDALNVTIPYKKTVMPFLDSISDEARRIGSVNTVVRDGSGRLHGYNTDYAGFSYMLDRAGIALGGRKVVILGSGGASVTARCVAGDRGAAEIVVISRSGEDNYTNLDRHRDADVLINTTPVGMFPISGLLPRAFRGGGHDLQPGADGPDPRRRGARDPLYLRPSHAGGAGGPGLRAVHRGKHPGGAG